MPKTVSQIDVPASWISYTCWWTSVISANSLLISCIFGARKNAFPDHGNLATVSHFVTAVSICASSSIDSEPRFHVSLILTATILPLWHSIPPLFFFSNSFIDSGIRFLITHPRSICINSSIDSDTRGRFASTVLWILRLYMFQRSLTVDLCTQFYRFWHSPVGALRLGGVLWSLGCWCVYTVLTILTFGIVSQSKQSNFTS